ncbi:hypothetical protein BC938DRAFT_483027 [Jimgerdemannia flammicorona]|uniref:Cytochrome P450 n=1 Tax=Jimgerdemannia flammicorona TaxID=994334 RepID=A0A433QW45_9FUNG|nr:hypothetical protein BC938DRAFT_483027 [Jimgerdemannia flammicorona]
MGYLCHYPRVLCKLREEVNTALDEIPSLADLTFDKVHSLKYFDCFLKEVFRLLPEGGIAHGANRSRHRARGWRLTPMARSWADTRSPRARGC